MAKKTFNYQEAMEELAGVMQKMQDEDTPLEDSYQLFVRGSELIAGCRKYLDETELKVKQVIDGQEQDFE